MKSVAKLFSLLKQRIIGGTNVPHFIRWIILFWLSISLACLTGNI